MLGKARASRVLVTAGAAAMLVMSAAPAAFAGSAGPAAAAASPSPSASGAPSSNFAITPIVDGATSVASYLSFANSAYAAFKQYVLGQEPADLLTEIQQAIAQSTTAIEGHEDAIEDGHVLTCTQAAEKALADSTSSTISTDTLQANAQDAASCVFLAENDITAESTPAELDELGLTINVVSPIALFLNAHAGLSTDSIVTGTIAGDQALLAKLKPTCQVFLQNIDNLPGSDGDESGPITGYGGCYSYSAAAPPDFSIDSTSAYNFPSGIGYGRLPWNVRGEVHPRMLAGIFTNGFTVAWPTISDYSIAANQAMADTSWPVMRAALRLLQSPLGPATTPLAGGVDDVSSLSTLPVELLRVNADGTISRNEVSPPESVPGVYGPLSGWTAMDGTMQSVAVAANANGRLEQVAVDPFGGVFDRWQVTANNDTTWTPWAQMTGELLTSVALARNQNGLLAVFGTDAAGNVWTRTQTLGADLSAEVQQLQPSSPSIDDWSPWKQLTGHTLRQLAAAKDENGDIELFGLDSAGTVWHAQESAPNDSDPSASGNWTAWSSISGPALASVAVTQVQGGLLNLFGATTSGAVVQSSQDTAADGIWKSWTTIAGETAAYVAAVTGNTDNVTYLAAMDSSGNVQGTANGGFGEPWKRWKSVPAAAAAAPGAANPGSQDTVIGGFASLTLSVSGGAAPYTYSASGLPSGWTFGVPTPSIDSTDPPASNNHPLISGSASTAGTYTITINVTDAVGASGSMSFSWSVTGTTVPDVLDFSQATAENTITGAGLTVGTESTINNCIDPGSVQTQDPGGGDVVPPGAAVNLEISTCNSTGGGGGGNPIQPK